MSAPEVSLSLEPLSAYLDEVFPQTAGRFQIEEVAPLRVLIRMPVREEDLRPGGTVSGPTMFAAADYAFYAACLAMVGREPLTVTTSLSINFMRKPGGGDLMAEARIFKLGRTLIVGDVAVWSDDGATSSVRPCAHASVTYARPPRSG